MRRPYASRRLHDQHPGPDLRGLAFGPEDRFVTHQGYHVAGWDLPNVLGVGRESLLFNSPGRMVSLSADPRDPARANTFCVFASAEFDGRPTDRAAQHQILRTAFAGMGWHVPLLLDHLGSASDLYFDAISRVDAPRWSTGRVALVGDAAHGATLGGMGTGAAMVGAFLLAGELARAGGEPSVAFPAYEARMRDYATRCQQGGANAGKFFAPRSRAGISFRNRFFSTRTGMKMLLGTGNGRSEHIALPDYGSIVRPRGL